jgi:hypothetical protein
MQKSRVGWDPACNVPLFQHYVYYEYEEISARLPAIPLQLRTSTSRLSVEWYADFKSGLSGIQCVICHHFCTMTGKKLARGYLLSSSNSGQARLLHTAPDPDQVTSWRRRFMW